MFDELGLHTLIERKWRSKLTFFYKIVNGLLPEYLYSYLKFSLQENYPLRSASTTKINPIPSKSKNFRKTLSHIVQINGTNLNGKLGMLNNTHF